MFSKEYAEFFLHMLKKLYKTLLNHNNKSLKNMISKEYSEFFQHMLKKLFKTLSNHNN